MCGIAGIFEYGREGSLSPDRIRRMRDTLVHRGPDGEGVFVSDDRRVGLGHRRLAIIDLAHGEQPMFGRSGEGLIFNGEIYNYPALRRELEADGATFRTACDTEVILHLYERHAERCVDHLNGMFAFALWDPGRERLMLARDRVGEKPLYWAERDGRLLFASEIKALLADPSVRPEVNVGALPAYLTNLVTPSPDTLYRGIAKLAPGTLAICDRDGMRIERYWDLFTPRSWAEADLGDAAATVRRMLADSVNDRLLSDVPVGVLLSGGLDSTTMVALLKDQGRDMASFSVGFDDQPQLDEREEARRVAAHFGTDHHEVAVSEADAVGFMTELVHHQDEPLADPVCIPLHFVCRLAAENGVKVVLAGEGADELFWGYPRYLRVMARWSWIERLVSLPAPLRRGLGAAARAHPHPYVRDFVQGIASGRPMPLHMPLGVAHVDRARILRGDAGGLLEGFVPSGNGAEGALSELAFDTQEYEFGLRLPELLLMRIDRFAMANSVEARVPFLDPGLVDFVYRLPLELKLHGGESKRVLRRAVADVVPDWVLNRRKQGFGAPVVQWMGNRLGAVLAELGRTDTLRAYFDVPALEQALGGGRDSKRPPSFAMWPIVNFGLWHRYWIEGERLEPLTETLLSG